MAKFADVLEEPRQVHGLTNVRWAEVGNEPNAGAVTLAEYDALVPGARRAARRARAARPHRPDGRRPHRERDEPRADHYAWMQWVAADMGDIFDG